MNQATTARRLEGLKALGFNSEAEYQESRRTMERSIRLAAKQKAASIAAGSTAYQPMPKVFTNGDANAIMVLTGQRMGLEPTLVDYAEKQLRGEDLHPVAGAALEKAAVTINDKLRHDPSLIEKANAIAERLKAAHGFSTSLTN